MPQSMYSEYETGGWRYNAATLSAGNAFDIGPGRSIGIRIFAVGADATFKIGATGDTATVRNGTGIDINPGGQIGTLTTTVTVTCLSGQIDVFGQFVT
jgi:hypothetical protein